MTGVTCFHVRRAVAVLAIAATVGFVTTSSAQAQIFGVGSAAGGAEPNTIVALASGTANVTPDNPNSNASIRAAVAKAQTEAIPKAVSDARLRAADIGGAAGLIPGTIVAVEDQTSLFGPFSAPSPFGANEYCGPVPSGVRVIRRNGKRRTVPTGIRRRCQPPKNVTVTLAVTFATTPGPVVVAVQ